MDRPIAFRRCDQLFAAFALTGLIVVFGWKMERLLDAIPNVKAWKHRFYRERDFTDVIYG